MSAGPFLVDQLVTWLWPLGRRKLDALPHRRQIFVWLMVIGVFWAGFSAWRDEKQKHASIPLNPLMIYQDGFPVADVGTLSVRPAENVISFGVITATKELDMTQLFEFRDWKMLCSGIEDGSFHYGVMQRINYENFSCRIHGLR